MTDITSIHDKFLRSILSDKDISKAYFTSCLPQNILNLVDLQTLTQLPDTYISKELRKTVSDIVYTCRMNGGRKELKISLLLEHKSRPDKFTPIQLLSYIASGYLKQIAQDKTVSPIVPVLLYHGKQRWRYRTLATLFNDLNPELLPFMPEYDYVYHDLGEIPVEQIEALENKFLQASLLALKYSQLKEELARWIPTILSLAMDAHKNLQSNIIVYTFEMSGLEEDEILRIMEDVPVNIKNTVMNTLDIFVEKGKKIGLQEKTEKAVHNLIKEGSTTDFICRVLEVTPEYVARIREELGGK